MQFVDFVVDWQSVLYSILDQRCKVNPFLVHYTADVSRQGLVEQIASVYFLPLRDIGIHIALEILPYVHVKYRKQLDTTILA